jgi:hypothetical protein
LSEVVYTFRAVSDFRDLVDPVDLVDLVDPFDERFVDESCVPVEDLPDWPEDDAGPGGGPIAALIGWARVDPRELDANGLVEYAVAWSRVMNQAAGEIAQAVVEFHDRIGDNETLGPIRLTAAEFGVALRLGSGAADQLVHTAVALSRRLPSTLAAVTAGDVSWAKAVTLAERAAVLAPENARRVEELVLPKAPDRTPVQHADAVRRAVDRIDPAGAAERRRRAEKDIALVRAHVGDGMGELFARLPSEQLETVWTAADAWARRAKAAGAPGTLDRLRVQALVRWAESFLTHGDPTTCDTLCDVVPARSTGGPPSDASPPDATPSGATRSGPTPPSRHGRPVAVRAIWDLRSFLGLADEPGELADSGASLSAETMRELVTHGARLRRLVVDPATGELLDLSAAVDLPATRPDSRHRAPVELQVVIPIDVWRGLAHGTEPELATALDAAPPAVRELLTTPLRAPELDGAPRAYPAPAALADFIATRDRHPTNPCAGRSAAHAADLDHTVPVDAGGATVRDNLASVTRRWHRLRTLGGWTVERIGRGWRWTSIRTGRTITTAPHDYRLGP